MDNRGLKDRHAYRIKQPAKVCNIQIERTKKNKSKETKNEMLMKNLNRDMENNTISYNIDSPFDELCNFDTLVNNKDLANDNIFIEVDAIESYQKSAMNIINDEICQNKIYKEAKDCTANCMLSEGLFVENSRKTVEDLQSLLIMMAMTSKDPDEVENKNAALINNVNKAKDLTLEIANNKNNDNMDFLNIVQLKSESAKREELLMKKYVNKWKIYVENKQNHLAQLRKSAINNFFDKLDKKRSNINGLRMENKSNLSVQDYKTYQHRYKMQKHIIALQKVKLEEQNRMIEELKYNKIIEASKQSVDTMKEEVRRTYYEIDRNLKPKIKCLTNELNLQEIEEPSLILHCLKVPQFLQRMEKRAREREEKHALIRERRRQMEEEKLKLKQQAEIAKAEMDKEEKIKRIIELREKRKREKIESIRKKQYAEKMRALKVMVDLHYERNLQLRCGIRPWIKLIEMKRDNMNKAKSHYRFMVKKNIFLHWMWHTEDMSYDRNYRAEEFYKNTMARNIFNMLLENLHNFTIKKQIAEDYYDIILVSNIFKKLKEAVSIAKQEYENKLLKADAYCNCNLIFKTFTLWRTLPALNALKREQEARKSKWRQKVLQVVPDYSPPDE